jgi:hypothetical protein
VGENGRWSLVVGSRSSAGGDEEFAKIDREQGAVSSGLAFAAGVPGTYAPGFHVSPLRGWSERVIGRFDYSAIQNEVC